jgi:hypothetical protein
MKQLVALFALLILFSSAVIIYAQSDACETKDDPTFGFRTEEIMEKFLMIQEEEQLGELLQQLRAAGQVETLKSGVKLTVIEKKAMSVGIKAKPAGGNSELWIPKRSTKGCK